MAQNPKPTFNLEFKPLTPKRWPDFETLFGPRGAVGGCWCMWWKLKRSRFDQQKGEANRLAMRELVESGEVPGLLAYAENQPIGWCAVAPRDRYPVLDRSPILKRVDDQPVWSITCFFIDKRYRGQGVMQALLQAAVDYVTQQGGQIVEGYPVEPKNDQTPGVFAFTGLASAFRQAGFVECARRLATRPIMRYYV